MATVPKTRRTDDLDSWRTGEREWLVAEPSRPNEPSPANRKQAEPDDAFRPVPEQLIERYVRIAVYRASVEELDDGTWFAETPRLRGVYGEGKTEREALDALASAIYAWVELKRERRHGDIPTLGDIDLNRG